MIRQLILPLTLVVTACAETPAAPAPLPDVVATCPAPAPDPPHPPTILTVERLRLFAQQAEAARVHDKAALRECTLRLRRAVDVIDAIRAAQGLPSTQRPTRG